MSPLILSERINCRTKICCSLIAASFILLIEICLGIPFVIMINLDYQLAVVALEWAMALTFNFYLWSLIGVLGYVLSHPARPGVD
jgi:hypothetical protein